MKRLLQTACICLAMLLASHCSSASADQFHLPGKPVERTANVVRFVAQAQPLKKTAAVVVRPVKAVAVKLSQVRPVRSVVRVLFF
jgi:hypothetical protein